MPSPLAPVIAGPEPTTSLGATLDVLAESLFFHRPLPAPLRLALARWIASRQGLPGAYAGMFAPTAADAAGLRLFTGERVASRVGAAHLLGEEACRVLTLLDVSDALVQGALRRALEGMSAQLYATERRGAPAGIYCCGTCSVGYWRNLALGLFPRAEERLCRAMEELKRARSADGRWRRFPFFATSLALTEIAPDFAWRETRYIAAAWERILPRLERSRAPLAPRRAEIGRRLLARRAA
jgi:hypothetical protein